MSQEQKQQQQKGDPILEGQELGIQRGKKEDVSLHTSFEGDDSLIEDTERMSRKLSGERDEVVRGDVREGVETRLHTTTAEPRFNVRWILSPHPWSSHLLRRSTLKLASAHNHVQVMSTTASGAADLPDTKLGGDVKHLGESVLHHKVCHTHTHTHSMYTHSHDTDHDGRQGDAA